MNPGFKVLELPRCRAGAAPEEIPLLSAAETQQMGARGRRAGVKRRAEGDVGAVQEENRSPP